MKKARSLKPSKKACDKKRQFDYDKEKKHSLETKVKRREQRNFYVLQMERRQIIKFPYNSISWFSMKFSVFSWAWLGKTPQVSFSQFLALNFFFFSTSFFAKVKWKKLFQRKVHLLVAINFDLFSSLRWEEEDLLI